VQEFWCAINEHKGTDNMQRKHIHLPDALDARVKATAAKLEMSMAEFIRRAIEAALENHIG
jgi:predicted DNA-binding protein